MDSHSLKQMLTPLGQSRLLQQDNRASSAGRISVFAVLSLFASISAVAQSRPSAPAVDAEVQNCAALMEFDLEHVPSGPAFITSAQLVDVPPVGLERPVSQPSGYGDTNGPIASRIRRYCTVTGYAAPQNRFELKLPLSGDWNQNFFFTACGGFCGTADEKRCNLALARGYASATGNGGHESSGNGFDAI